MSDQPGHHNAGEHNMWEPPSQPLLVDSPRSRPSPWRRFRSTSRRTQVVSWIGVFVAIGVVAPAINPPEKRKTAQTASSVDTAQPTATTATVDSEPAITSPPPTTTTATAPTPPPTTPSPTVAPTAPPTTPAPTPPPTVAPTAPPTTAPPTTPAPTPPPTPPPTLPPTTAPPIAAPPPSIVAFAATCDANYSGCVPIDSDVDCAGGSGNGPSYARGPVNVIGSDIYDLDRDGDGVGCE